MASQIRAKAQPADSAKVKAFCKRLQRFAGTDSHRAGMFCTGWRVAPGVWVACDGQRLAIVPAPVLANGLRWGDDCPIGQPFLLTDLATACDLGVPVFRQQVRPAIPSPYEHGHATPEAIRWVATAGDAIVWQVEAQVPEVAKVIPTDLPRSMQVCPRDVAKLKAEVEGAEIWTPAERLRLQGHWRGGKAPQLGAKVGKGTMLRLHDVDGFAAFTIVGQGATKTRDADTGELTGAVDTNERTWGDDNGQPAAFALDFHYLREVSDDQEFTLHYTDQIGPVLAMVNGEAHLIMPMRMN